MKKLILILGANGVGKSITAAALLSKITKCAYIDSDWCRAIHPFPFTEATKLAVTKNIYSLIKNYLTCDDIETVIFTYGFHGERKQIYEQVIFWLKDDDIAFEICPVILKCSKEENIKRAENDGRDRERIARGIENTFAFYNKYPYPKIDTTDMSPEQVAEEIKRILKLDK